MFSPRFRDEALIGVVAKSRSDSPSLACAKFGVVPADQIRGFGTAPGLTARNPEASISASLANSASPSIFT
jgi:hypothetical protein